MNKFDNKVARAALACIDGMYRDTTERSLPGYLVRAFALGATGFYLVKAHKTFYLPPTLGRTPEMEAHALRGFEGVVRNFRRALVPWLIAAAVVGVAVACYYIFL